MRKIFGFLRFESFRRCKSYLRRCGAFARTERNFPAFGPDTPLERRILHKWEAVRLIPLYSLLSSSVMFQLISCIRGSSCLQCDHSVINLLNWSQSVPEKMQNKDLCVRSWVAAAAICGRRICALDPFANRINDILNHSSLGMSHSSGTWAISLRRSWRELSDDKNVFTKIETGAIDHCCDQINHELHICYRAHPILAVFTKMFCPNFFLINVDRQWKIVSDASWMVRVDHGKIQGY